MSDDNTMSNWDCRLSDVGVLFFKNHTVLNTVLKVSCVGRGEFGTS